MAHRVRALQAQICAGSPSAIAAPESNHAKAFAALELDSVPVAFNYFDYERFHFEHGPEAKPHTGQVEGPEAAKNASLYNIKKTQPVCDARGVPDDAVVLDEQGFKLYQAPTALQVRGVADSDWYNRDIVDSIYLQECADLICKATGATRAIPFDYVLRNRKLAKEGKAAGYGNGPHNDHTLVSGPRRVREMLGPEAVNDEVMQHRFALMNVWRRWDGGNDWPLGACSYPSLDYQRDMVPTDLVYKHRTGETYMVRPSDSHRFFWWSDMTKDEAVVLKIYDSDPNVARGSLHTGFRLPDSHRNMNDPTRESMEVRLMVFWAPEEIASKATMRDATVATNVGGMRTLPTDHLTEAAKQTASSYRGKKDNRVYKDMTQ